MGTMAYLLGSRVAASSVARRRGNRDGIAEDVSVTSSNGACVVSAHELHEVLAVLSLAGDAANGLPFETSLRTCAVAARLAAAAGCSTNDRDAAWHAALLRFLGCTAFAHDEALAFGADDVEVRRIFNPVEPTRRAEVMRAAWRALGTGSDSRPLRMGRVLLRASALRRDLAAAACEVGRRLADRLGMPPAVGLALAELHERWDGKGVPDARAEASLSPAARILHVATVVEAHMRLFGEDAAVAELRRRAGGHLDPTLVAVCIRDAADVLQPLRERSVWDETLAGAPSQPSASGLDAITDVFADFVDLKTPYALGHSRRVADLAGRTAAAAGLGTAEVARIRHAGRIHDLGHVAVGNDVWEQQGPLSPSQWEVVRLHPYHARRALERSAVLAPLAGCVASHHERIDGSGYPHGASGAALPFAARVLAVADVYVALREPRAHREAHGLDDAARTLEEEVRAGRLDARATACLFEAIGRSPTHTAPRPAGLSDREIRVLCELARGGSNKQIARTLEISPKTVQHHVRHIYEKIGVKSRAAATLFAVEQNLLDRG